ncbi:ABC transporter permease [Microbacterium sp.]|uniref:ABC transporter permease n=1 Tax=Microbacterium sp. TaxID=51671 RepID=UPI0039E2EC88
MKLVVGLVMLFAVTVVVFFATQGLPGDTARAILGQTATDASIQALREQLGLDRPLIVQYGTWLTGVLRGDFGVSLVNQLPVWDATIAPRLGNSLALMFVSSIVTFPLAILVGIRAAAKPGGILDRLVSSMAIVFAAVPAVVLGLTLLILFSTTVWKVFPGVSSIDPGTPVVMQLGLFVLPACSLAVTFIPNITYNIRARMLEELSAAYVLQARVNGVPEGRVLWRHALRNAVGPALQVIAVALVSMTGGAVVVETIYGFPGLGSALNVAITYRDLPVIQGIVLLLVAGAIVIFTLVDILGLMLTPRLREGGSR